MSESSPPLPEPESRFVEQIALYFEHMGLPRTAGRILGVLLIADPPAQSLTEISRRLGASKGTISIMARLLAENGLVERVASPVPRSDYYQFKPGGWILYIRQWMDLMAGLHRVAEYGLSLMADKTPDLQERLQEAHDLFSLLEERLPALIQELEVDRSNRLGSVHDWRNKPQMKE